MRSDPYGRLLIHDLYVNFKSTDIFKEAKQSTHKCFVR